MTSHLPPGPILSPTERDLAFRAIEPFRKMNFARDATKPEHSMSGLSKDCLETVVALRGGQESEVQRFLERAYRFRRDDHQLDVWIPLCRSSEGASGVSSSLAPQLGVEGWEPGETGAASVAAGLPEALALIAEFSDSDAGLVGSNSGILLPFHSPPPVSGSSSALQLPGVLLLPAGVPPVILAEYWLHEALHNELYLGEWLEGGPPAVSESDLPTPWREMNRPAAMLLHGAFVFSRIGLFMTHHATRYEVDCRNWHLSATPGLRIAYETIHDGIDVRLDQVEAALRTLEGRSEFTDIGRRAFDRCWESLGQLGRVRGS